MAVAVGQVSDLVDHQQVLAGIEAQLALEQGVAVEGGEFTEHAGGGGEAHGVALEDGAMGDIGGDGRLSDAVGTDQDDVGGLAQEVEAHEVLDGHPVAAPGPRPVEVGERLELSEAGVGEAPLEAAGPPLVFFPGDQRGGPVALAELAPMGDKAVQAERAGPVDEGVGHSSLSSSGSPASKKGKIVTEARVASAPESLVAFMRELPHGIAAVGLEAGPLSNWLHKGLTDAGFEAVLMETRQVKAALKAMPIKTDRRDAERIARLLQMGWFRPVHCKSVSSQEMRALLTSRRSVLDALTDLELSLRGVLRNFGLKMGQVSKGRYEARVRELIAGNAMLEAAADPILRARAGLRRELAGLEKLVRNLARQNRVCRLLMTMPGVGHVIALTFTSAIDDPERFRRSKDLGPWVGLTPGRNQSGERDLIGRITKAGDAGLRCALYQAATVMLNHAGPNWLKAWAQRLTTQRGKKRATVALARRIGVVLHRMWRDGTEFRFTREEAMALQTA